MYNIVAYGAMIADERRIEAYGRALEARIGPGAVVADIGTGSGVMALMACRAGASRVYAIEPDDVIQVAREVAVANGFSDRIRLIQADSSEVDLPEPVDGIVSDLRGALPFFGGGLAALIDARDRWLKPGGWLIAERDTLWVSLISSPRLHAKCITNWDKAVGFDFSVARARSANTCIGVSLGKDELLTPAQQWADIEYAGIQRPSLRGEVTWTLDREATGHGLGVWFDTETARGLGFSNSPESDSHGYRQVFFPWPEAVTLAAGDELRVTLRADLVGAEYLFAWGTDITHCRSGERKAAFRQSTFNGAVLSPDTLRRRVDTFVPDPNEWAPVDRRVLGLMDGRLSVGEIADRMMIEFPHLLNDRLHALTRVGGLSERVRTPSSTTSDMSGFFAVVHLGGAPADATLLGRMMADLAFRGPDGQRAYIMDNAGFGHALLRTTDEPALEAQPFSLDGRTWLVGDARVDAREELIDELRAREPDGCPPDAADIELIARAYQLWGEDCVTHLLGDFAFAVWDEPHRRLFCARDQLGVKPLFYAQKGQEVIVSNTLDVIRLHPAVSRTLHEPAIADFLLFGVNQTSDTTAFRDIRRLPPAHSVTWSKEEPRYRRYWTLPVDDPVYFKRADDYGDRFQELLRDATRDRLRTRRVGVLMSGGVDSSTLAAAAQRVLREGPTGFAVQAITSVYERLIPDTERHYAGLVAAHLNVPIRYDVRDDETSIVHWDRVSVRTPEPVANPTAFAAGVEFLRTIAGDARVLLYGEGPDNALRYEWRPYLAHLASKRDLAGLVRTFVQDLVMHPRVPLWSSIRQMATARRDRRLWHDEFPRWLDPEFVARQDCRQRWDAHRRKAVPVHPLRPLGYAAFDGVYWQDLFEDCDITGASSHTEFRHPFLDLRVVRYLLALPAMPWCRNKLIIRRSMRAALPAAVLRRRKTAIRVSADFTRVLRFGFPRLKPSAGLLDYVNPRELPSVPRSETEMRAALRPLGLNYWLQHLADGPVPRDSTIVKQEEYRDETAHAACVE